MPRCILRFCGVNKNPGCIFPGALDEQQLKCRRSLYERKKSLSVVVVVCMPPSLLGEAHGYCVLQRFAAQRGDACPSPDVTVRGSTQLRRTGHVGRTGQGCHPGESGLVEVRL